MKLKRKSLIRKFDNVGEFGTIYIRKRTIADASRLADMLVAIRKKYNDVPTDLFIGANILSCLVDADGEQVPFETEQGDLISDPLTRVESLVMSYHSKELDSIYAKVIDVNPLFTKETIEKKKDK